MRLFRSRAGHGVLAGLAAVVLLALPGTDIVAGEKEDTVPITTSSEKARELYLEGRTLFENLRFTDARSYFEKAAALDDRFVRAHLGLSATAASAKDFFDALERAVAAIDHVSEGERLMALGQDAGARNSPALQREYYQKLVMKYPRDQRAHSRLGTHFFGQQDWASAIEHLETCIELDSDFASAHNMLGYSYRFAGNNAKAETSFRRYIELIPDEPNPYDSYAELLMKMGRFEESIENYRAALEHDPQFVASYVGIGNNFVFLNQPEKARETFRQLTEVARTTGEQRQAVFWTAASHVYEGHHEEALKAVETLYAIAKEDDDWVTVSGDLHLMGDILLESGSAGLALAKYEKSLGVMEKADAPEEVKEATRRNHTFDQARVELARGDLETAKALSTKFRKSIEEADVPAEKRQAHELEGLIALHQEKYARAIEELQQADQQNPRVLYQLAIACKKKGDHEEAREACEKAANYNGLNMNYAYVRTEAKKMLASLD